MTKELCVKLVIYKNFISTYFGDSHHHHHQRKFTLLAKHRVVKNMFYDAQQSDPLRII
jgi:hypothetical protein